MLAALVHPSGHSEIFRSSLGLSSPPLSSLPYFLCKGVCEGACRRCVEGHGGYKPCTGKTRARGRIMNYPANRAKLEFPGKVGKSAKVGICIRNPYLSILTRSVKNP